MQYYEVGKTVDKFIGHQEGVVFDIDDAGATLLVFFDSPTDYEVEQFESNSDFEMRLTNFSDVMVFTFKFGNLNWMDAPYNPHLSKNLTVLQDVPDDKGYVMAVIFVDSHTGIVKNIRLISLSTGISREIKKSVVNLLERPFDKARYYTMVSNLLSTYSTKQLVAMANTYYKLR